MEVAGCFVREQVDKKDNEEGRCPVRRWYMMPTHLQVTVVAAEAFNMVWVDFPSRGLRPVPINRFFFEPVLTGYEVAHTAAYEAFSMRAPVAHQTQLSTVFTTDQLAQIFPTTCTNTSLPVTGCGQNAEPLNSTEVHIPELGVTLLLSPQQLTAAISLASALPAKHRVMLAGAYIRAPAHLLVCASSITYTHTPTLLLTCEVGSHNPEIIGNPFQGHFSSFPKPTASMCRPIKQAHNHQGYNSFVECLFPLKQDLQVLPSVPFPSAFPAVAVAKAQKRAGVFCAATSTSAGVGEELKPIIVSGTPAALSGLYASISMRLMRSTSPIVMQRPPEATPIQHLNSDDLDANHSQPDSHAKSITQNEKPHSGKGLEPSVGSFKDDVSPVSPPSSPVSSSESPRILASGRPSITALPAVLQGTCESPRACEFKQRRSSSLARMSINHVQLQHTASILLRTTTSTSITAVKSSIVEIPALQRHRSTQSEASSVELIVPPFEGDINSINSSSSAPKARFSSSQRSESPGSYQSMKFSTTLSAVLRRFGNGRFCGVTACHLVDP